MICLACGSPAVDKWATAVDREYFSCTDVFSYYRCSTCDALSISPVPRDRLDLIYPSNYYSFDQNLNESLTSKAKDWLDQRYYRKFLSELTAPSLKVLDIGGGSGIQLTLLRKTDPRITVTAVVDLSESAGVLARQQGHEYFCGRFEEYTPKETFNVVLMLNLIEHVDNPGELLQKAHDLLAPDGIVIIKTPNTDSLDARLFRNRNWGGFHCPRHWVLFNRENFSALAARSGFDIHDFRYTQGAPFWTSSMLMELGNLGLVSLSPESPTTSHPLFPFISVPFAAFDFLRVIWAKTSQMQVILKRR